MARSWARYQVLARAAATQATVPKEKNSVAARATDGRVASWRAISQARPALMAPMMAPTSSASVPSPKTATAGRMTMAGRGR